MRLLFSIYVIFFLQDCLSFQFSFRKSRVLLKIPSRPVTDGTRRDTGSCLRCNEVLISLPAASLRAKVHCKFINLSSSVGIFRTHSFLYFKEFRFRAPRSDLGTPTPSYLLSYKYYVHSQKYEVKQREIKVTPKNGRTQMFWRTNQKTEEVFRRRRKENTTDGEK